MEAQWGQWGGEGALKDANRVNPYYTLIHRPYWALGADHGFTDDDSMQEAFFLIVVAACLGVK